MPRDDLTSARQTAANAQAALDQATARVRELESLAAQLNARLAEANERAEAAETRLLGAIAASDMPA